MHGTNVKKVYAIVQKYFFLPHRLAHTDPILFQI